MNNKGANNRVVVSNHWDMSFELKANADGVQELVQTRTCVTRTRPTTHDILRNELLPLLACIVPAALYARGELKDIPYSKTLQLADYLQR